MLLTRVLGPKLLQGHRDTRRLPRPISHQNPQNLVRATCLPSSPYSTIAAPRIILHQFGGKMMRATSGGPPDGLVSLCCRSMGNILLHYICKKGVVQNRLILGDRVRGIGAAALEASGQDLWNKPAGRGFSYVRNAGIPASVASEGARRQAGGRGSCPRARGGGSAHTVGDSGKNAAGSGIGVQ